MPRPPRGGFRRKMWEDMKKFTHVTSELSIAAGKGLLQIGQDFSEHPIETWKDAWEGGAAGLAKAGTRMVGALPGVDTEQADEWLDRKVPDSAAGRSMAFLGSIGAEFTVAGDLAAPGYTIDEYRKMKGARFPFDGGGGWRVAGEAAGMLPIVPSFARMAGAARDVAKGAEEMVNLTHYGNKVENLDVLDPAFGGSSINAGRETQRAADYPDEYLNRIHFYTDEGVVAPRFKGMPKVEVQVPRRLLASQDDFDQYIQMARASLPEGRKLEAGLVSSKAERMMMEDGLEGWISDRGIAVKFTPTSTGRAGVPTKGALPMDEASREARAAAQGFSTDAYHWSPAPEKFEEMAPYSHFGTQQAANDRYLEPLGTGKSKMELDQRRESPPLEGGILPARIRGTILNIGEDTGSHNPISIAHSVGIAQGDNFLESDVTDAIVDAMTDSEVESWAKATDQDYLLSESEGFTHDDLRRIIRGELEDPGMEDMDIGFASRQIMEHTKGEAGADFLTRTLKVRGIDALAYVNNVEDPGSLSFIVPDPSNVRSRFAKFDPENIGKRGLLGMADPTLLRGIAGAGGGALAGGAMDDENPLRGAAMGAVGGGLLALGPEAMRAARGIGEAGSVPAGVEKIVTPSVRFRDGRVVSGKPGDIHSTIIGREYIEGRISKEEFNDYFNSPASEKNRLFETTKGRHVSRDEARNLSDAAGQTRLKTDTMYPDDLHSGEFVPAERPAGPDWTAGMASTEEFGGATIDPRTGDLLPVGEGAAPGYIYSPYKRAEVQVDPDVFRSEGKGLLSEFAEKNADLLAKPDHYLGTWHNRDTDRVFLDVAKRNPDLTSSLAEAEKANQKAIFQPSTMEDIDVARVQAKDRMKEGMRTQASRDAVLEEIRRGLSPADLAEFENSSERLQREVMEHYLMAPTPDNFSDVILQGRGGKGWYEGTGEAIMETFGTEDGPRFAALVAAMSPQKSVEENLNMALDTWRRWTDAGRPSEVRWVQTGKKAGNVSPAGFDMSIIASDLGGDLNNAVRALTADSARLLEPGIPGILSGPKVDAFYANMVGETQRVVNDTHMALGYGTLPKNVGSKSRSLAVNAMMRNATAEAGRRAGTTFTPREGQEMSWGAIRGLRNAAGGAERAGSMPKVTAMGRSLDDPSASLFGGATLQERITDNVPISDLFNRPRAARELEMLGLEPPGPHLTPGLVGPLPEGGYPRNQGLLDMAQRIDAAEAGKKFFGGAGIGLAGSAFAKQQREKQRRGGLLEY